MNTIELTDSSGREALINLNSFEAPSYMTKDTKFSAVGLMTGIAFRTRLLLWTNPNHFMTRAYRGEYGWFIICCEMNFNQAWYSYFSTCATLVTEEDIVDDNVVLTDKLTVRAEINYVGDKVIQVSDIVTTSDGTELGSTRFLYGLVDLRKRKMVSLEEALKKKAPDVINPTKPLYIKVEDPPTSVISREDTVESCHIDSNSHTNISYYFSVAQKAFDKVRPSGAILKKFVILCKKESLLGDTLLSSVWQGPSRGQYFCRTTTNDRLLTFIEAQYVEHSSKL